MVAGSLEIWAWASSGVHSTGGVARIFQWGEGWRIHIVSNRGYSLPVSSFCHRNNVGCLVIRRLTNGGGGGACHGHARTPLATPLSQMKSSG